MEYIIPRKLIGWNIKLWFSLFRVKTCTFLRNNWENIKHSLSKQIFQEHINSIITGLILPKQLQIQLFKFYSKDWLFLKISTKIFLRKINYANLNLVKFQLQSISQQKDIENGILLPISNSNFFFQEFSEL